MNRPRKNSVSVIVGSLAVLVIAAGVYLRSRVEVIRLSSPSGDHTVVVSERRFETFLPRAPGDGRGAPGFVEIFDRNGSSCGRIPVPMIQFTDDLEWTPTGAAIRLVGEWDLQRHSCVYWSEDQDRQIWVRR